jgi:hypothetical protein
VCVNKFQIIHAEKINGNFTCNSRPDLLSLLVLKLHKYCSKQKLKFFDTEKATNRDRDLSDFKNILDFAYLEANASNQTPAIEIPDYHSTLMNIV